MKDSHIPVLHSNTSVLEAHFYLMPASKGGTALKHTRMVVTIDIRHQLMAIESNPMHGSDFIQKKTQKLIP